MANLDRQSQRPRSKTENRNDSFPDVSMGYEGVLTYGHVLKVSGGKFKEKGRRRTARPEVRSQRSEVRGKNEGRGAQKPEIRGRRAEISNGIMKEIMGHG